MSYEEFLNQVASQYFTNPDQIRDGENTTSKVFAANLGGKYSEKVFFHIEEKKWEMSFTDWDEGHQLPPQSIFGKTLQEVY
jgi:hypothetical protein